MLLAEHPANQAADSIYSSNGRETHSTMLDMSVCQTLIKDHDLLIVNTEQCASGAATRKPTALVCCQHTKQATKRILGTQFCTHDKHDESLVGLDEDNNFVSRKSRGVDVADEQAFL